MLGTKKSYLSLNLFQILLALCLGIPQSEQLAACTQSFGQNLPLRTDDELLHFASNLLSPKASDTAKALARTIGEALVHHRHKRFLAATNTMLHFFALDPDIQVEPSMRVVLTQNDLAKHMQVGYWVGHQLATLWHDAALFQRTVTSDLLPFYFHDKTIFFPVISIADGEPTFSIEESVADTQSLFPPESFEIAQGRSLNENDQREWLILGDYFLGILEESWHWLQDDDPGFATRLGKEALTWVKESYPRYMQDLNDAATFINKNSAPTFTLSGQDLWEKIQKEADIAALLVSLGRPWQGHSQYLGLGELSQSFAFFKNRPFHEADSPLHRLSHSLVYHYIREVLVIDPNRIVDTYQLELDYADNKPGIKTPPLHLR